MAYNKGRFYEVESILYKVIWTMSATPDELLQARALLGNALRRMGRTSEAEKELRKAMELSKAQGKGATKAEVLLAMGKLHFRKGYLVVAEELTKEGQQAAREVGNAALAGKALMDLAGIYVMRGNYDAAEPKLQEAIRLFQLAGARSEAVRALHNLGYVFFHK